jgi:protoporphyrinogen oxidase
MKNIAIAGCGIAGLTLAYRLLESGHSVTMFETYNDVAGQLYAFDVEGVPTEIYYHHTFLSDTNLIRLCEELGIDDKLEWLDSSMAYYTSGTLYAFGTPMELLKFKPLAFMDKIRFILSILRLQKMSDIKEAEKWTAKDWFTKNGYSKVWDIIWEPLFKLKFADKADSISLVWLWDKLIKRGKSRGGAKEKLCYMKGSFFELAKELEKRIMAKGGQIIKETTAEFEKNDGMFTAKGFDSKFDIAVSTVSSDSHKKLFNFGNEYMSYLDSYKYQGVICALLVLKNRYSDYYWTNIGDYSIPFGGIIEHTNFVGSERYNGKSIVYLSKYLNTEDPFFSMNKEDMLKEFYSGMKKVNPDFDSEDVTKAYIFKHTCAQPVVPKGYEKPSVETDTENLYWISTHHVYPHDRGIEYAIEQANELYKRIIQDSK